ncbi:hypothetical protein EW15_0872 [Prochlorococcus sp. MIT 0801]|nr:hypothetical protein EW15_0872 [Prochlorococcus sp. MIT 0801]
MNKSNSTQVKIIFRINYWIKKNKKLFRCNKQQKGPLIWNNLNEIFVA